MSYRVFIVEDQIDAGEIVAAFATDAAGRGRDDRLALELAGLAQNESDARDQLEALESSDAGLPDAIVIDDVLPDGGGAASPRGIAIMRWLCERAIKDAVPLVERPRTVLWSTCPPNVIYAFCSLGGLQYRDKRDLNGRQVPVAAIWRALAGQRWRPDPYPDERDLPLFMRDALPFLDHGWTQKKTALHLGLGERGLSGFTAKVKGLPRAPGPTSDDFPANDAGALRVLKQSGWVWVPHALHGQVPASAPFPLVIDPPAHAQDLPAVGPIPTEYRRRSRA